MKKELIKKMMRGMGILLAIIAAVLATCTLRFALYAPELLTNIFAR